jgi:D-alanine-D-alanine ligase
VTLLYDVVEEQDEGPKADAPVYKDVARCLEQRGHEVSTIVTDRNIRGLVTALQKDESDIVFNLCESLAGEDRKAIHVAALLELLEKPFTGTGSLGQMLAHDKALAKKIFGFHGISCPKFSSIDRGEVDWSDELKFPLFVKPANTDSSVGIDEHALVEDIKQLMERISYVHTEIGAPALIEEFIDGREMFVAVLGNEKMEALPIVEWDFSKVKDAPKFATAEAKWDKSSEGFKAPERFPDDIPESVRKRLQETAVTACKALRIHDYGRVDFRVRPGKEPDDWELFVIEVNPNPYLHKKAEMAMAARKAELSYPDLVERILDLALKRPR